MKRGFQLRKRLFCSFLGGTIYSGIFFTMLIGYFHYYGGMPLFTVKEYTTMLLLFVLPLSLPFYFIRLITLSKQPWWSFTLHAIGLVPALIIFKELLIDDYRFCDGTGFYGCAFITGMLWGYLSWWAVSFSITTIIFLYDTGKWRMVKKKSSQA